MVSPGVVVSNYYVLYNSKFFKSFIIATLHEVPPVSIPIWNVSSVYSVYFVVSFDVSCSVDYDLYSPIPITNAPIPAAASAN